MMIGDRIRSFRIEKGLTQNQLAELLGESSGRVVYAWEKGNGKPDCDKTAKLCAVLGVSADELLGCKTDAPTLSEWSMIKKYRVLDEHGKELTDYVLNSEYNRTVASRIPRVRMIRKRFYDYPASAGTGSFLENATAEELDVPESDIAKEADFIIPVSGDSMEPTYRNGDRVFVNEQSAVNVGEIGIFIINGDAYIKELGENCLISHNSKYKKIPLHSADSVYCCGKVIGCV